MVKSSFVFLLLLFPLIQAEMLESSVTEELNEIKQQLREIFRRLDQLEFNAKLVPSTITRPLKSEPAVGNRNHATKRATLHVERLVKILAEVATVPASQKFPAHIPQSKIFVEGVTPKNFTCDSQGKPLDSCLWGRMKNGTHQMVLIDHKAAPNRSSLELIPGAEGGLNEGECTLKVESLLDSDVGRWSCTLVAKDGAVYSGEVDVIDALNAQIYFGTSSDGMKSYTLKTSLVSTVIESSDYLLGIAFDPLKEKVYWCKEDAIYRADRKGTGIETLLNTREYGPFQGLGFDQSSGTLYVIVGVEQVLACDTKLSQRSLNCTTILRTQGYLLGITVNSIEPSIYYTTFADNISSIFKAGTDGSDPIPIITGLGEVHGLAVDNEVGQLLWTDSALNKIQSSNLTGGEIQMVVQLASGSDPYGIQISNRKIYWGNRASRSLQSCAMDGTDVRILYEGSSQITHLTIVPAAGR